MQNEQKKEQSGKGARRWLRRFAAEEDGALIILSIQIFLVMLVCTGIAIDLVRQEERRTLIQNTIDRAALAAASLSQDLDPEFVVKDYVEKAGLSYLDIKPVVEEGSFKEWRRVTISVKDRMPTIFGPLVGVTELAAAGNSQAEESVGNVEISLVLDISGSMDYNIYHDNDSRYMGVYPTRMDQLRPAALNFVDQMFDTVQPPTAPAGRLSISIVPYNQQVTLGSQVSSVFKLSSDHTKNTCADLEVLSDTSIAISPSTTLQRTMYGDSFDYWGQAALGQGTWSVQTNAYNMNCKENSVSSVLAFSNDQTTINNKINALTPGGDTAIDIGARWGLGLLDPAARPALTSMISKNWASSDLAGRPLDYDDGTKAVDETSMKVLVLMTDGQNTRSYSTKPAYRTGESNFVSTVSASAFSNSSNSTYWNGLYYYDASRTKPYYSFRYAKWYYAYQMPSNIYPITWDTIWDKGYSLQYVIQTFLYPPMHSISYSNTTTSIYEDMAVQSEFTDKDTALSNLCTTAKDKTHGIVVFTVAVNAPTEGREILRKCATADSYAYNVTASGLTDAFASIASSINSLRLTN
ncbi:MAG: TadE/TadG family type IV pilus assembly protein [Paenirhodobacter sp.]